MIDLNNPQIRPSRMRKGAAWDAADQLLPIEQDECELEMVLDDVPPGIMTASTTVACLIMLLMAVLAEFTLLRAAGYSGPAVFFPAAAVLLFIGIPGRSCGPMTILITAMLLGVSYRLAVHGNLVLLVAATWLLAAYTLALRHQSPFFIRTTMFAIESLWGGWEFILAMHAKMTQALVLPHEDRPPSFLFNFGLPLAVLAVLAVLAEQRLRYAPTCCRQLPAALHPTEVRFQACGKRLIALNCCTLEFGCL